MSEKPKPLSARALGRELGITHSRVMELYYAKVIPALMHEGKTIRFDVTEVREVLAKRAEENRDNARLPSYMVPTC